MSVISTTGLITGIDYERLISGILQLERQPITRLENRKSDYNTKVSIYNQLSSKLSALKSAADKLRTTSNFYAKTASVSDSTILDAITSNSAAVGNYTVGIHSVAGKIQLATEEKEVHSGVASSTTVINGSGSDKVFQYTYAGTQRSITVANATTLEGLRDLINNDSSNPGVTASIFYDGSSYRLSLTGDDTGSTKTITIDNGTTLDGTNNTIDFRSSTFTQAKTAQDAKFSVDGVNITSSSNTISDVISGVTFTLKTESTSSVTISITNDTDTISQNIQAFVTAYNDVVSYVSTNSTYNTTDHTGGALYAESTPRNILNRMRSIITSRVTGSPEDMRTLAQLGVSTNRDGTITLNTSTLNSKLASDLADVANLFTDSSSGIAVQLYNYIDDDVTDTIDGSIVTRVNGLNDSIRDISADITKLEARVDRMEESLRKQFALLESLLGGVTAQGRFLTNQLNVWNKG